MLVIDYALRFLEFFWSVFSFWAVWQTCDWILQKCKVRLKKPWVIKKED